MHKHTLQTSKAFSSWARIWFH